MCECVCGYECVRISSAVRPRDPGPRKDIELPTMGMDGLRPGVDLLTGPFQGRALAEAHSFLG